MTYPPGLAAETWHPGDFILTHGDSLISRAIRFGERIRIHGADRKYTWFNHTALVLDEQGNIAEAQANGIEEQNVSKYLSKDYVVVSASATAADRDEVIAFARWALDTHHDYGFVTVLSIFISTLTGSKFTFFIDGTFICSGFVARAMERTSAIFNLDPVHITPADLAKYYDADPPGHHAG